MRIRAEEPRLLSKCAKSFPNSVNVPKDLEAVAEAAEEEEAVDEDTAAEAVAEVVARQAVGDLVEAEVEVEEVEVDALEDASEADGDRSNRVQGTV